MNSCFPLKLYVKQIDQQCTFDLYRVEKEPRSATLPYPLELDKLYKSWQRLLRPAYPYPDYPPEDLSINKSVLQEAENKFLKRFQEWLGDEKLIQIREAIRDEINDRLSLKNRFIGNSSCVNLIIACNLEGLARLPWEAWQLTLNGTPSGVLRISRTFMNIESEIFVEKTLKQGKKRILAVVGDTSGLNLNPDIQAVQLLEKSQDVCVEWFQKQPNQTPEQLLKAFRRTLVDGRGWDALIFAGHCDKNGQIELAPDILLNLSQIQQELTQAKNQGLKIAIFISCWGFRVAEFLIKLGLSQVLIMREEVHDTVSHAFTQKLCESLANYKDIQEANLVAHQYLKSNQFAYPSAYLIPSLFRHPSLKTDFQLIRPFWNQLLQNWMPTRKEAIMVSSVLLLGLLVPIQDLLLDCRYTAQYIYRRLTHQLPTQTSPDVYLISIDQNSLDWGSSKYKNFEYKDAMDREFLAEIVNKLSALKVKTIGINYQIYTIYNQASKNQKLATAINTAIQKKNTRFVIAYQEDRGLGKIADPRWTLQGDDLINSGAWYVELPDFSSCDKPYPFAYLLALSHRLNQEPYRSQVIQPSLNNQENFQQQLCRNLEDTKILNNELKTLKQIQLLFYAKPIIDFSLPPENIYKSITAKDLIKGEINSLDIQNIQNSVVIITSGGYEEATDNFLTLQVMDYRCSLDWTHIPQNCPKYLTGGEVYAYMVNHINDWLTHPQQNPMPSPIKISDFLLIFLAAFLGKWTILILVKQEFKKRKRWSIILAFTTIIYGVITLQLYILPFTSVLIPWLLPSVIFWIYLLPIIRRSYNV